MRVYHLVLFKWKPNSEKEQALLHGQWHTLKGIPGVLEVSWGENFSPERAKGFTFGLCVVLKDKDSLKGYGPHPIHQKLVTEFIAPIREDILALDYEY